MTLSAGVTLAADGPGATRLGGKQYNQPRNHVVDKVPAVPGKVLRDRLKDGSLGPEMVVIPPGSFRMGAVQGGGDSDEKPVHVVTIIRPFLMGKYEVTFE